MDSAWFESVSRRGGRKAASMATTSRHALAEACHAALSRSQQALLDLQKQEGFWCGDLP